VRVAVCQLNSRDDREINVEVARSLLEQAAAGGADLAILPEYTDYLGPAVGAPPAGPVDGDYPTAFSDAARELGMWVHAGSFHEAGPDPAHTYNTSLVFDRSGVLTATYRKIHLYDVEIPGRVSYLESASVSPGTAPVSVAVEGHTVGLSICYDLRFPELYRHLAVVDGATILVVPAAFMLHTGRDHWEVLLRARAIENQCYLFAPAQGGRHSDKRITYGHAMVVDPWGLVTARASEGEGLANAPVDSELLARIRRNLPCLQHRRLLD